MTVLSDGIGDRDIPGASAKQLVDVSHISVGIADLADIVTSQTTLAELADVSATVISSKDL